MKKSKLALPLLTALLVSMLLSACVTESSGGFNVEASDENALEAYIQLSMGYLRENDLPNVRRHLNNAMQLDSRNSTVYGLWGLLYSAEGDTEIAAENFKRSLRIDAKNSRVRNNYAVFLFANAEYEEAYEQLQEVVRDTEYSLRSQAFENMGLAALQLKDLENAEIAFLRALQLNPNQINSVLELTELYLNKRDIQRANNYYNNYLSLVQLYRIEPAPRGLALGEQLKVMSNNGE